ncbi:MAG: hypothetical protein MJ252_03120 [archaeon]|nr:hypothetical protein [archaeon]
MEEASIKQEAVEIFKFLLQAFDIEGSQLPVKALDYLDRVGGYQKLSTFNFIKKKDIIKTILNEREEENLAEPITVQEFISWYSQNALKELLYQRTMDQQKFYIEDLTKLYLSLGGREEGIPSKNIRILTEQYVEVIKDKYQRLRQTNQIGEKERIERLDPEQEFKEIFDFLAESEDIITLEEFVNIMACATPDSQFGMIELAKDPNTQSKII